MSLFKKFFFIIFFGLNVLNVVRSVKSDKKCEYILNSYFICYDIISLGELNKAPNNVTSIRISDSNIYNIPEFAFIRFQSTLSLLDLHESHINAIEPNAFNGLPVLEKLILWGNNLVRVSGNWFGFPNNLKHLDLSFNQISDMTDINFFYKLNQLRSLYLDNNKLMTIDYNLFSTMPFLNKIQIGNNPWQWNYRVLLMWQLKNQRVSNDEVWDNWEWLSYALHECKDKGHNLFQGSEILYCTLQNMFDFLITEMKISNNTSVMNLQPSYRESISKALEMTQCFKSSLRKETPDAIMTAVKSSLRKISLMDQTEKFRVYS